MAMTMAMTAGPMPASTTSTRIADPTAATIAAMITTTIAGPMTGATAAIGVTAVILEVIPVGTGDIIDLKWAQIDNEWVIYQSELDEWVKTKGQPYCPVCKGTKGVRNSRNEGNIKRGVCASCGARLAIMRG